MMMIKSGKTVEYPLGENKSCLIDDEIHKDNILLRKWQKGNKYRYDILLVD